MTNILIIDNDECLGYFGLINGIYNNCINSLYQHSLNNIDILDKFQKIFIDFSVELLKAGYARNYLDIFFEKIKSLKSNNIIHKVVMMTSNKRYIKKNYKGYFDWIIMLKLIFENYSNKNESFQNISIYDLDYSCINDEVLNKTDVIKKKKVSKIIEQLNIIEYFSINKIVFIDDKINYIDIDDIFEYVRVILLPVRSYFCIISKTVFYSIICKYCPLFTDLNIISFKDACILNYNHDKIEMGSQSNNFYTNLKNDADLNIDLEKIFKCE